MSKKGLFVLHEGVGSTIFASQVMEHVLSMERIGIRLDILTFETFREVRNASKKNLQFLAEKYKSVKVGLKFGMNIYLPFSTFINAYLLALYLVRHRNEYSFIHARADYTTFLSLLTKPIHGLPVVWDCRGDAVGELHDSLSRRSHFLRGTLGLVLLMRQRFIIACNRHFSDGAIFVSNELLMLHLAALHTKNYAVIPCPVPEDKFFFDAGIRKRMRMQHGVSENQRVFIYSGSVVAYQGLAEQLDLYKKILTSPNNIIFFATPDLGNAREYFRDLLSEQFRIVSVKYHEMNDIYNLADFAFMLRESKKLNWVSSPTKFGEYCLTGLSVILNDTIQQAAEHAKALGNYIHINDIVSETPLRDYVRHAVAEKARKIYSRGALSRTYADLYAATCR